MDFNTFRPLARKVLTPILRYALETPVVVGERSRVSVGERVALANAVLNTVSGTIAIGDRTILSPGVMIMTGRHQFTDGVRTSVHPEFDDGSWGGGEAEVPLSGHDILIGRGVWIGSGAIILGDVTIGDHSIVGAGAVVTRSFPDHSVIVGVPARRVRDTRAARDEQDSMQHDA